MAGKRRGQANAVGADLLDRAVTERQLQAWVMEVAKLHNWLAYHTWSALHSPRGFPDVVLVRGHRLIFAELKREGQQPTAAQQQWLDALSWAVLDLGGCGECVGSVEVAVWRPSDRDRILEMLR